MQLSYVQDLGNAGARDFRGPAVPATLRRESGKRGEIIHMWLIACQRVMFEFHWFVEQVSDNKFNVLMYLYYYKSLVVEPCLKLFHLFEDCWIDR